MMHRKARTARDGCTTNAQACCCHAMRRHTAGAMVQLWALMLPLGFGGVAIFGQLQGLTADTMGPADMVRSRHAAGAAFDR